MTFVAATVSGWPHAPWWEPVEDPPASLLTTGQIAGALHARGVEHPWLARATELMWSRLAELEEEGPYGVRGSLRFLEHVPDRDRAEAAFERVVRLLDAVVELDPDAAGEVHGPLAFAPTPDSLARRHFDDATIAAHLDRLARGQLEDGGWMFNWPAWSPLAQLEWRGSITVDALRVLRANGRV